MRKLSMAGYIWKAELNKDRRKFRKSEVHHDYLGWYVVTPDEERDEGGFGPDGVSLGFDGRKHYATEAEAWAAVRADVLADYREECKADWQRTGEDE